MVLALAPGKFYGGSLPRPWIYGDVKFNSERVDPPSFPSAPLLSWANEAHWSMGGLSSKRKRIQRKIEGSIKNLRATAEEDAAEDLPVSGGSEASKPSAAHAAVAEEGIVRSGMGTNEKLSGKGSPGVQTQAKKPTRRDPSSYKAQKSDQGSSGFVDASDNVKAVKENVGFRASPRNKKRKGESEGAGVEPKTSKGDISVRRSGRISSPGQVGSRVSTKSSGSRSVAAM